MLKKEVESYLSLIEALLFYGGREIKKSTATHMSSFRKI